MKVAGFMTPADKVVTVSPFDTIRRVMELMQQHKIGAVIVLQQPTMNAEGLFGRPLGIITKSDILDACLNSRIAEDHPCNAIMVNKLATITPQMSRDQAAHILEMNKNHHAIVVDDHDNNRFAGVLSSWDITVECAKDHRAWPWNRSEDGKFHNPHQVRPTKAVSSVTVEKLSNDQRFSSSPTTTIPTTTTN